MAVVEVPAVVKGDCLRTLNVGKMPAAIDGLVKHVKAYEDVYKRQEVPECGLWNHVQKMD